MGPIGAQEMIFIFILALLLFGPKKLPELAKMLGKGLSEFRRAKNELQATFNTHMQELERETRIEESNKKAATQSLPVAAATAPNPYAYAADEFGQTSGGYGYNGSAYPSEPPVQSNWQEPAETTEPPASSSNFVQPVPGSVPRSNGVYPVSAPEHSGGESKEEHSA